MSLISNNLTESLRYIVSISNRLLILNWSKSLFYSTFKLNKKKNQTYSSFEKLFCLKKTRLQKGLNYNAKIIIIGSAIASLSARKTFTQTLEILFICFQASTTSTTSRTNIVYLHMFFVSFGKKKKKNEQNIIIYYWKYQESVTTVLYEYNLCP